MVWFFDHEPSWSGSLDYATVSSCIQLVIGPTHERGGTLDLLLTDVPDLVWVAVVAQIGNSDHSSLSVTDITSLAVPNLCVSRGVPETSSQLEYCLWYNMGSALA